MGGIHITTGDGIVTEASKTVSGDDGFDQGSTASESDVPDEVVQKLHKGLDQLL